MKLSPQISREVDLSDYKVIGFNRGASVIKEGLWIITSLLLFQICPFKLSSLKRFVLRLFGATVGVGVVIKPHVKITFPWKLSLGDHVWLGEECWILNLAHVTIQNNVCLSQRAFLCAGSHNYNLASFELIVLPIVIERGAWIGSGAWVGPGVTVGTHAVLTASSVASKDLVAFGIYQGNPAQQIRSRVIAA